MSQQGTVVDGATLMPTGKAARALDRGESWVRKACDAGRIKHIRDSEGHRLIPVSEIARVQAEREAKR